MTRPIVNIRVHDGDLIFFPGDPHFGAEDPRAHEVAARCAEDAGCTLTISPGDTFDSLSLSSHPKASARSQLQTLEYETGRAAPWIRRWRDMGPVHLIPGNHEERWYPWREKPDNQGFQGTEWWHPHRELADWAVFLPRACKVIVGKLLLEHGHLLRGHRRGKPAHSQETVLKHYPSQNTGYGHVHSGGSLTKTTWKHGVPEHHKAFSVGHLQDVSQIQGYEPDPNMGHGFALIRIFPGGMFEESIHTIHPTGKTGRGRVVRSPVTGKEYRA